MATDIYWPTSLPQNPVFGVSCSPRGNTHVTANSTGYDKVRPRFTKRYRDYSISMELTLEQYDELLTFYHIYLGYGELSFNFPDPLKIETYIEVRIVANSDTSPISVTPWSGTDQLLVSFDLESLDERVPTVAPANTWPTQLPQIPLHSGFNQSEQSGVIKDSGDSGAVSVRRRFTAVSTYNSYGMILDKTQLVIFEAFFADQGFGALPFLIEAPIYTPNVIYMRWVLDGNPYDISYDNRSLEYSVSFGLMELPGQNKVFVGDENKVTSDNSTKQTSGAEDKITDKG